MFTTNRIQKIHSHALERTTSPFFQPKLTVNTPGDAHEQEADRVADQVMRMREGDAPIVQRMPITPLGGIQRKCTNCKKEEKEQVQRKESSEKALKGFSKSAEIFSSGDTDTEKKVDNAIKQSPVISPYIQDKLKKGKQIEGRVRYYYDRKSFEQAHVGAGNTTEDSKNVGGFYKRKDDKIHLPPSPRLESLIHEGVHMFSENFLGASSFVNEGITQLFTNIILKENGISNGSAYPDQLKVAESIRDKLTLSILAESFFKSGLKTFMKEIEKKVPKFDWAKMFDLARKNDTANLIKLFK